MATGCTDRIMWKTRWDIWKWNDPEDKISKELQSGAPIKEVLDKHKDSLIGHEEVYENVALNEGLQNVIELICGLSSPNPWSNTYAYIGVGTGSATASASDTGLGGSTSYKGMDTSYPSRSGQTATWRATFGTGDANFEWYEYTVCNSNSNSGSNLNRKVELKGTKTSAESWTMQVAITLA